MSETEAKPMTGAQRYRERLFMNATPSTVQFDRELREVLFLSLESPAARVRARTSV